ncbi:hypothetical protein SANTM175S_06662 [Streptomyces antimycoticus]
MPDGPRAPGGIPVLDRVLTFEEIADWAPVIRAIEGQTPLWEPDTSYEYHGHVFGFLIGEVIRRITGHTPGAYFRQAVADPLGLRAWIGLPTAERDGRARLVEAEGRPGMPGPEHLLTRIVTMNGALAFPGLEEPHGWNDPTLLGMELPGAGATASATGLAGLYAAAVTGIEGHRRLLSRDRDGRGPRDLVRQGMAGLRHGSALGLGLSARLAVLPAELGERSFGNDGAGGQFAFGDDEFGVGFAYVANRMIGHGDGRATRLVAALRGVVRAADRPHPALSRKRELRPGSGWGSPRIQGGVPRWGSAPDPGGVPPRILVGFRPGLGGWGSALDPGRGPASDPGGVAAPDWAGGVPPWIPVGVRPGPRWGSARDPAPQSPEGLGRGVHRSVLYAATSARSGQRLVGR